MPIATACVTPAPVDTCTAAPRLRVAMIAASLDIIGGHGVQQQALQRGLTADGHSVTLIPINPRPPPGLSWVRRVPGVRTAVTQARYLPSLAQLAHADVVHVFAASYWSFLLSPVPAILFARQLNKPVVLHYHSGEADDHLARWGAAVHPWLKRVDAIVVPSEYLERVFARHGYRAHVIPNVVDLAGFPFRDRTSLQPRLITNRNLEPYYRVDVTLRAFAQLRARHPGATLTVAGSGSQAAALQALARDLNLDDVRFIGAVAPADMPALMGREDIFVNASTLDNQPVSVLEAFALGLPVVSTGSGDIANMLGGGAFGSLVPPDDPRAVCDAIAGLLERPTDALARARRARTDVERYTWPAVGATWAALYAHLVQRRRDS